MTGAARWAALLRSFAVQGSWNYETLTGTGFAFVMLPALRRLYPDPASLDAAVQRHAGTFNSHPYLAPLAVGAVIRMEEEGEDPAVIERFKAAARGSLGTLGDQLIWVGWRPFCVLLALAAALAGAAWWVVVALFLSIYNVGHVGLMLWSMSVGLAEGRAVAERLRGSIVQWTQPRIAVAGSFAAGAVIALLVIRGIPGSEPAWGWSLAAGAAALAGAFGGGRSRRATIIGLVALTIGGLAVGVLP